jgi:hypothetical protein
VHLFGFIIRIYHDARSPERQITEITVCKSKLEDFYNVHREMVLNLGVTETAGVIDTRLKKIEPNIKGRVICYELLSL